METETSSTLHTPIQENELWHIGMKAIQDLEVERGILASSREELYGCVFGRDSLITSMLLMSVYKKTKDVYLLTIVRKVLINLAHLQGREVTIQSGEEPGKIIHEFRPENHEHLTKDLAHPWFLYADGVMRNYDTVDATPLYLMTLAEYLSVSNDAEIFDLLKANVHAALAWLLNKMDTHVHGFVSYEVYPDRTYGGLTVQSWMDSGESIFFENPQLHDEKPSYPIAPIEVQAYAYQALCVWEKILRDTNSSLAVQLKEHAETLKENFGTYFVFDKGRDAPSIAYAIDGASRPLLSARSSMGHCLWAGWRDSDETFNSILSKDAVSFIAERLMKKDLFVPGAGIRTLSSDSSHFQANSYHNGSIWPHDTALIAEGLAKAGYVEESSKVRRALIHAYEYFQTPIELFVYDQAKTGTGQYALSEYRGPSGQGACRVQAWSAAGLLAVLSQEIE